MSSLENVNWRSREFLITCGAWSAVASLFFTPINKPATNIAIALALLCSLLAPRFLHRFEKAVQHPVALGLLVWWFFLLLSVAYAQNSRLAFVSWSGMIAFAYPHIILSLIGDSEKWRTRAISGFMLSLGLIMAVSYLRYFGLIPQRLGHEDTNAAFHNVAFKEYTQQGLASLMACVILVAMIVRSKSHGSKRWLLLSLSLCMFCTLFVIKSRTTLAVALLLAFFLGFAIFHSRKKARLQALLIVLIPPLVLWTVIVVGENSGSRVPQIFQEITQHDLTKPATSSGIRIELWRQSLLIIERAPLLGHGYDQWHTQLVAQTRDIADYSEFIQRFPHQEYLLIASEQGLVGLTLFIFALLALARYIYKLPLHYAIIFGSLLLIYASAGVVNSLLADFTHRHLFLLFLGFIPYLSRVNKTDLHQDEKPV